jgi:hypothetical protein
MVYFKYRMNPPLEEENTLTAGQTGLAAKNSSSSIDLD